MKQKRARVKRHEKPETCQKYVRAPHTGATGTSDFFETGTCSATLVCHDMLRSTLVIFTSVFFVSDNETFLPDVTVQLANQWALI